jgi:hypothetical protein
MSTRRSKLRYLEPARWRRFFAGQLELAARRRLDNQLDRILAGLGPVARRDGESWVIADGMWLNPNHFFRLRLFVTALAARGDFRLLGVLRKRRDARARRALERIGFRDFVFVEEDDEHRVEAYLASADAMLANTRSHADLLALELPHGLPAYVWYDTALKQANHPQPPIGDPIWRTTLAEALRDLAIYARELRQRAVAHVALSHPWKSEYGALVWLALRHRVPAYHVTGFTEALRMRRLRETSDYATPVEHLSYAAFRALPATQRARLAVLGHEAFAARSSGQSTDINARYAYRRDLRIGDREAARRALSGQSERPIVVVFGHVWYDFPHTFAMTNFTDFLDWMRVTLQAIRGLDRAIWLLKPHPTEAWYGRFFLSELAVDLPSHVRVLPLRGDAATVLRAADAVVTVHGTVGLEAVANGVPALFADRSYYSDWALGPTAASREDYVRMLADADRLPAPDAAARERAAACFALALAEPPHEAKALRMSCDSGGSTLYPELIRRWTRERAAIDAEVARIGRFLDQTSVDSYAAFHLLESQLVGPVREVQPA